MEKLFLEYEKICNKILKKFCEKHDFDIGEWVGDEVGTVAEASDYSVDFNDMITDLKFSKNKLDYIRYYDYCLENFYQKLPIINYKNWLKLQKNGTN